MKYRLLSLTCLMFVVGALTGCGKSSSTLGPTATTGGATAEDQAQVSAAVSANLGLIDEDAFESSETTEIGGGSGFAAIRPLRFVRTIDSINRRFEMSFGDPDSLGRPASAVVTIHKHLLGKFNILAGSLDETDTTTTRIQKPLDDRWVRRLALKRVRIDSTGTRQVWRVVGVSGAEVTSKDATSNISSLRIQAGAIDTTITNPLELHRLRRILLLDPSTPVRLTATTGRNDDVVLLYRHLNRRPFANNGDGTYTSEFVLGDYGGLRHIGVNALSNGTLNDDQAPYDSNAWIVGFAVRPADCEIGPR